MGIFDNLFTSPREREGKDLNKNLLNEVNGTKSGFEDVNTFDDVSNKFGVNKFNLGGYQTQVGKTFAPAKRNIANRLAQARSAAGQRMSSRNATPEAIFNPIEGQFANAFGDLEGQEANANLQGFDKQTEQDRYIAEMLKSILGGKDQFGLNKMNLKSGATNNYVNSLSNASTFDDILSLVGTGAKVYGATMGGK